MNATILRSSGATEFPTTERCLILELFNSSEDLELSVARARVHAGTTTQLHRLRDIDERYVITEGSGQVEIAGKRDRVRSGDVVIIPRNTPQRITNDGDTDLTFLCVCTPRFEPTAYESLER